MYPFAEPESMMYPKKEYSVYTIEYMKHKKYLLTVLIIASYNQYNVKQKRRSLHKSMFRNFFEGEQNII